MRITALIACLLFTFNLIGQGNSQSTIHKCGDDYENAWLVGEKEGSALQKLPTLNWASAWVDVLIGAIEYEKRKSLRHEWIIISGGKRYRTPLPPPAIEEFYPIFAGISSQLECDGNNRIRIDQMPLYPQGSHKSVQARSPMTADAFLME